MLQSAVIIERDEDEAQLDVVGRGAHLTYELIDYVKQPVLGSRISHRYSVQVRAAVRGSVQEIPLGLASMTRPICQTNTMLLRRSVCCIRRPQFEKQHEILFFRLSSTGTVRPEREVQCAVLSESQVYFGRELIAEDFVFSPGRYRIYVPAPSTPCRGHLTLHVTNLHGRLLQDQVPVRSVKSALLRGCLSIARH